MTNIPIPDEVVEAGGLEIFAHPEWSKTIWEANRLARAVIESAIAAWPDVKHVTSYFTHDTDHYEPAAILPLPQEKNDD